MACLLRGVVVGVDQGGDVGNLAGIDELRQDQVDEVDDVRRFAGVASRQLGVHRRPVEERRVEGDVRVCGLEFVSSIASQNLASSG